MKARFMLWQPPQARPGFRSFVSIGLITTCVRLNRLAVGHGRCYCLLREGHRPRCRMVQTNSAHRLTVLLADEQEGWAQTVRGLLAPQGVQTVPVRTGREALRLIESGQIHVAVLDTQMPQLGGL